MLGEPVPGLVTTPGVPLVVSQVLLAAGVRFVRANWSARTPATCGVAMEVPLMVLVAVASNPVGGDGSARSEKSNACPIVRERGTGISVGSGTYSNRSCHAGRRRIESVAIVITGSNGIDHTSSDGVLYSLVEGGGSSSSKGHAGNRRTGGTLVVGDVVDARDDTSGGSRPTGAQHLHGLEAGLFGNTIGGSGNGARAVSSVSVEVSVGLASDCGENELSAGSEVDVGGEDTGVNDVNIDSASSNRAVNV